MPVFVVENTAAANVGLCDFYEDNERSGSTMASKTRMFTGAWTTGTA